MFGTNMIHSVQCPRIDKRELTIHVLAMRSEDA